LAPHNSAEKWDRLLIRDVQVEGHLDPGSGSEFILGFQLESALGNIDGKGPEVGEGGGESAESGVGPGKDSRVSLRALGDLGIAKLLGPLGDHPLADEVALVGLPGLLQLDFQPQIPIAYVEGQAERLLARPKAADKGQSIPVVGEV